MDLLESGGDRPPLRLSRRLVAGVVLVGLLAALVGAGLVRRVQREAADVSAVTVRFAVGQTTRAGNGSAYGVARLEVTDPSGDPVEVRGLDVEVPGLRLGPQGVRWQDLGAGDRLVLRLRLAVPDCAELVLPGTVRASVARPGHEPHVLVSAVQAGDGGAGSALLRACGRG